MWGLRGSRLEWVVVVWDSSWLKVRVLWELYMEWNFNAGIEMGHFLQGYKRVRQSIGGSLVEMFHRSVIIKSLKNAPVALADRILDNGNMVLFE